MINSNDSERIKFNLKYEGILMIKSNLIWKVIKEVKIWISQNLD